MSPSPAARPSAERGALVREQGLFLAVLVIVGWMTWSTLGDRYRPAPPPPKKYLPTTERLLAPPIEHPGADEDRFERAGRDFFIPPRDWNPLPFMILDQPPLPEISAVGPLPDPRMEPDLYAAYRRPPVSGAVDEERALEAGGAGGNAGSADEPPGGGSQETAVASVGAEVDDSARFDWVRTASPNRRLQGFILNRDKLALLDNREPIEFQAYLGGRPVGTRRYERSELAGGGAFGQGFGFADTVSNRVALLKHDVRPSPTNLMVQLEAARKCLTWFEENERAAVDGALFFVESVLSHNPKEAAAWALLARIRRLEMDTDGELLAYGKARELGVLSADLLVGEARALRRIGLFEAAAERLDQALALAPNDIRGYLELGDLRLEQQRADEAIPVLEQAAQIGAAEPPMRVRARILLARARLARGQLDGARRAAEDVFKLDPDNPAGHVILGVLHLVEGDHAKARGELRTALERDPRNRDAVYDLAVLAAIEGDVAEARARFAEAMDLAPLTGFWSVAGDGVLEELLGNVSLAHERFHEALELHPDHPFGLYRFGRTARRLQDLETANDALTRALRLDGRMVDVLNELALVAILTDRPREAELYAAESLRREPQNREARVLLGDAFLRQGRVKDAQEQFEQATRDLDGQEFRLRAAATAGLAFCRYNERDAIGAQQLFAEARSWAETEVSSEEFYRYADRYQALIDDHHRKEQWVDVFDRDELRNGWDVIESFGPLVRLVDGAIRFTGEQNNSDGGRLTCMLRDIDTKLFSFVEATLQIGPTHEGMAGVRWVVERPVQGRLLPYVEVSLAFDRRGNVFLYQRTGPKEDEVLRDFDLVAAELLDPDEPHTLTIERVDEDEGVFQVKVDGKVLELEEPLKHRSLKNLRWDSRGGVFVRADARRKVDATCPYVRVVRYMN